MEQGKEIIKIYNHAALVIKNAILQGQYDAAKGVNRIQLSTYFAIGKYVAINTRKGIWGTGALKAISERLYRLLPGLRGYSESQLKFMRQFYEEWEILENKSLVATNDLELAANEIDIFRELRLPNLSEFPVEDFFKVPFTHHCRIIGKVKDLKERYYYIHRCAEEHMSVERLLSVIEADEFNGKGHAPNNFFDQIEDRDLARKAVLQFKDSYILDYINAEEIGERDYQDIDERVVEQQIVHNIKKFIMTFGKDFAFVGNQYHLEMYSENLFPDLLFFNRELNALVVVELKMGKFKSGYPGQLLNYLTILDDKMRKPHENPSIGIVLCKEANRNYVEYIIKEYKKPMGVATYITSQEMPEALKDALPDMDELKKLL